MLPQVTLIPVSLVNSVSVRLRSAWNCGVVLQQIRNWRLVPS